MAYKFYTFTSLFNIHSLHDIHGSVSIIYEYKQVIEVNIEANNA